ncbi:MAG: YjgP/YjgQ family permease [Pyrinomonadaceae bacterium]|nr:YjgP/YjgQ family permease [Pyrinomonadaceae bacterium]
MAIVPYFILVWLLLSVILFVQQGSRYSELIFDTSLPDILIWQLTFALIPSVLAFTSPIALLVGVIIGLSRMQGDSEMTAMRAAGVGNRQIILPVVTLGLLLSVFALFVNLVGVPAAAQVVRQVAIKAALYKLESPVDPGIFNTEIQDLTIFVRDGDIQSGKWKRIFILQGKGEGPKEPDSGVNSTGQFAPRLITAGEGYLATKGEDSEIVLENAQIVSLDESRLEKFAIETVDRLRIQIMTKRGELIERLSKSRETPEEMGLRELGAYAGTVEGTERTEALLLWQRRIVLSITPLIFSLLGAALVSKFNRGGRGFGIVLALGSLVIYYLMTLLSEQLARTGTISAAVSAVAPVIISVGFIFWLFRSRRVNIGDLGLTRLLSKISSGLSRVAGGNTVLGRIGSGGTLDKDIIYSIGKNYLVALGFLILMYEVFTAFELWKFAGTFDGGVALLSAYLVFLIPFIYLQISPSALMVAAIATYVIKTRQNEVVTWTAAGRSVYRILMPAFAVALFLGMSNLLIQETIGVSANRLQDRLRDQIRSRNEILDRRSGSWVAGQNTIVSFDRTGASDNEIEDVRIYHFDEQSSLLKSVSKAENGFWKGNRVELNGNALAYFWSEAGKVGTRRAPQLIEIGADPLKATIRKPSHLSIGETRERIESVDSDAGFRKYTVALHKKYTTPFVPLIIVLLTAPFALSIHRQGNVVTIAYAAGLWLLFIGSRSVFEQVGVSGLLSPWMAVWGPLVIMGLIGLVMLSRVRT